MKKLYLLALLPFLIISTNSCLKDVEDNPDPMAIIESSDVSQMVEMVKNSSYEGVFSEEKEGVHPILASNSVVNDFLESQGVSSIHQLSTKEINSFVGKHVLLGDLSTSMAKGEATLLAKDLKGNNLVVPFGEVSGEASTDPDISYMHASLHGSESFQIMEEGFFSSLGSLVKKGAKSLGKAAVSLGKAGFKFAKENPEVVAGLASAGFKAVKGVIGHFKKKEDLVSALEGKPEFSDYLAIVKDPINQDLLDSYFKGDAECTVLAPSNESMQELYKEIGVSGLDGLDDQLKQNVIGLTVFQEKINFADEPDKKTYQNLVGQEWILLLTEDADEDGIADFEIVEKEEDPTYTSEVLSSQLNVNVNGKSMRFGKSITELYKRAVTE